MTTPSISLYEEEYRTYHRKNPELIRMITEMEENEYRTENDSPPVEHKIPDDEQASIHPRFGQIVALDALERTLEEEAEE